MAFPPYVLTRTVSVGGAAVLESSDPLRIRLTITASKSLINADSGYRFKNLSFVTTSEAGTDAVAVLPRTDLPGWKDARTGDLIDVTAEGSYTHQYMALVEYLDVDGNQKAIAPDTIGPFVVPAGDGAIDLDKLIPVGSTSGEAISFPAYWNELVQQAQESAAAAQAALIDSAQFIADEITTDGTPAALALGLKIDAVVDAAISGAVGGADVPLPAFVDVAYIPPQIVAYGDSITQGGHGTGDSWPALLAGSTGIPVVNRGLSGTTASEIAIRMGVPQLLTVAGGQIPAGTLPVSVTVANGGPWSGASQPDRNYQGTVRGVPVVLSWDTDTGTWTLARLTAGTPAPVASPVVFVPTVPDVIEGALHIIWAGRNNYPKSTTSAQVAAMVKRLPAGTPFLVVSITNRSDGGIGTGDHADVTAENARLQATYPYEYVDMRGRLIREGLALAGIAPTAADSAAIANDRIPPSLMADVLHPNGAGRVAIAKIMEDELRYRGNLAAPTLLPSLGVSGQLARYHADAVDGEPGAAITTLLDQTGNGHDAPASGALTLETREGVSVIKFGAAAAVQTAGFTAGEARSFAMLAYIGALPGATVGMIDTANSPTFARLAMTVAAGVPYPAVYGGVNTLRADAPLTIGWHVIIGVLGNDDTGAIVYDGVTKTGAVTYATPTTSYFRIAHASSAPEIIDVAMFDHALDAEEIATVHAALLAQQPA